MTDNKEAFNEDMRALFGQHLGNPEVPRLTSMFVQLLMQESRGMEAPAVFMAVGMAAKAVSQMMVTEKVTAELSATMAGKIIEFSMGVRVEAIQCTQEEAELMMAKMQGGLH